jgi:membrane fusion protein (multidrug efflux system)
MKRSAVIGTIVVFVTLALVGGGLALLKWRQLEAAANQQTPEMPTAVSVVDVTETMWGPRADLVGTVVPVRTVVVRNELAGVVTHVGFTSGQVVEAGTVLLKLDTRTDEADLAAAEAAVRVAEAAIDVIASRERLALQELERIEGMAEARARAEVDLDRARSALDTTRAERARAQAEVDQARARVDQVRARLAKMTIAAPFRGRAGIRSVHEGQYLAEGADVVVLHEVTDNIYLDFAIPQEYAPRVTPGTAVMATGELLGPEPVRIEVVATDATVNNATRNLRVRAVVDNRSGVLQPGMFLQISVPVEEPRARVTVPGTAVRRAAYADAVYVIVPAEEGKLRAKQRFVTLGPTVGEQVVVLEGLEVGERVAASGSFKLYDGALVASGPPPGMPGAPGDPGVPGTPGAPGTPEGAGGETAGAKDSGKKDDGKQDDGKKAG